LPAWSFAGVAFIRGRGGRARAPGNRFGWSSNLVFRGASLGVYRRPCGSRCQRPIHRVGRGSACRPSGAPCGGFPSGSTGRRRRALKHPRSDPGPAAYAQPPVLPLPFPFLAIGRETYWGSRLDFDPRPRSSFGPLMKPRDPFPGAFIGQRGSPCHARPAPSNLYFPDRGAVPCWGGSCTPVRRS